MLGSYSRSLMKTRCNITMTTAWFQTNLASFQAPWTTRNIGVFPDFVMITKLVIITKTIPEQTMPNFAIIQLNFGDFSEV